jgi:hypothetical protein
MKNTMDITNKRVGYLEMEDSFFGCCFLGNISERVGGEALLGDNWEMPAG